MIDINNLSSKIFSLLKGNNLQVKIYDEAGSETTDPSLGRRFFVSKPNIMVTIDEESGMVEFNKGSEVGDKAAHLQKRIKQLADEFLVNYDTKIFGRQIQPRDYAYQAKIKKAETMMENNISPVNHHLMSEVLTIIKRFGKSHEYTIQNNVGTGLEEIRPVLNRLVQTGKVKAEKDMHGDIVYSIAMDEAVYESFSKMFGSLMTSRQVLENVRILVRHKTPVDESVRGSRSRHISAIFLEANGERFRFPHNYLPGARAMAQHMSHGGNFTDKVGSFIIENTGNLLKLQSFNRYVTTNKLINEDSSGIVETVKENIETIRNELKKLTGVKTYESVRARIETFERETLAEDDVSGLKDLFTIRRFDEKFEEVLPIVKQLIQEKDTYHKRIEEAASNTIRIRRESMNMTPVLEFKSENSKLGYKINEFALRIMENDELSTFISKIGNKLVKEGQVNDFEKAILKQVFENAKIEDKDSTRKEIKESVELDSYFDKYIMNFY